MAPLFKSHPDYRPARKRAKLATRQPRHIAAFTAVALAGLAIGTAFGANLHRVIKQEQPSPAVEKQHVASSADRINAPHVPQKTPRPSVDEPLNAVQFGSAQFDSPAPRVDTGKPVKLANVASKQTAVGNKPAKADDKGADTVFSRPPIVDIAETEADTVDIEARLAALSDEHFKLPTKSITYSIDNEPPGGLRKGHTIKYANLRAGSDNDAEVLAIMPANSAVLAEDNCVHWCSAVYRGTPGFIYKTLITYASESAAGQPPQQ